MSNQERIRTPQENFEQRARILVDLVNRHPGLAPKLNEIFDQLDFIIRGNREDIEKRLSAASILLESLQSDGGPNTEIPETEKGISLVDEVVKKIQDRVKNTKAKGSPIPDWMKG